MDCKLLFVYGTLRRGGERHAILVRLAARFAGRGSVRGELFDLGEYPGARPSTSLHSRVFGELYLLRNPARAFEVLDRVEGYRSAHAAASLFHREIAVVERAGGGATEAWIDWLNRARHPFRRILSGNYVR